ncbi:tetratricopeptide repeat protein [Nocardioides KLBMP 9356]|uniref:Tetratricopeptide repeat protein n=1 Tax=Nocardioides potassii TaxID=2911371 RepID=A0ABS9HF38_9ACTN|nr:tetratricopeptide repeat protein [Nocardioides potassii]MCF6378957.1 tetratricopeptide repeat protein [Nocardioides potassii]
MSVDLRALWDFDDPAASEQRFRELAEGADEPLATYALTQVARALGLQESYGDGHALLDDLSPTDPEGRARVALERGRLLRSGGDPAGSRPQFEAAVVEARAAALEELEVDALHMVALVAEPGDRLAAHHAALTRARASKAPAARDWDASLLNNIGMEHADAGDHDAALSAFEQALAARRRIGDPARTRVAQWMVGWSLRHLGEVDRAREVQLALKAELESIGEHDPYVDEELALLDAPSGA